jgi:hypothetical protein
MKRIQELKDFNLWRRGAPIPQPDPKIIGENIDWAIKVAEAAKKLRDARGRYNNQKAAEKLFKLLPYDDK